jgi:hypothetical protein
MDTDLCSALRHAGDALCGLRLHMGPLLKRW